jgi:O-antigen ligase
MRTVLQNILPDKRLSEAALGSRRPRWFALLSLLSVTTVLFLALLPEALISWDGVRIICAVFVFLLALSFISCSARPTDPRTLLNSALFIWVYLLLVPEVFDRSGGDADSALAGQFSVGVYGEVITWILILLVLFLLFSRNHHWLRSLFSGHYRWLTAFGLLCAVSTIYSPRPMFSIGWSLGLWLVILVLRICVSLIRDADELLAFVRVTFWTCSIIILAEVCKALTSPLLSSEGGRFGESPTSLSVMAGLVVVLSLVIRSSGNPGIAFIFGGTAFIVMLLAAGKAGIIGSVLSLVLFFLLKKKVGSALLSLGAVVMFGFVLLSFVTPLKIYVDSYANEDQVENLTGRTDLWAAAMPIILQKPILGQGYMASKFVALQIQGVRWEASHMHNGFLEVLYNNGLVGLILILGMQVIVVRNIFFVIKQRASGTIHEIAIAFLALYANLLINSFFNASIGGRPSALFMIFLALFALSANLRRLCVQNAQSSMEHYWDKPLILARLRG